MSFLARLILLLGLAGPLPAPTPEARELVRQALKTMIAGSTWVNDFIYLERVDSKVLNDDASVKSIKSKTHEWRMIEGSPYRKLVEVDGKPVPEDERQRQELYLKDNIERRSKESPKERSKRIEAYVKRRDRYLKAISEIPDAFDFQIAGEEAVGGRPAWIIKATPRPGYDPQDRYSALYPHMSGRIWIDKAERSWTRIEAELTEPASFGWLLVRIAPGARVVLEQQQIEKDLWLPRRTWYRADVRIGLIKRYHIEEQITMWGFRRVPARSTAKHQ